MKNVFFVLAITLVGLSACDKVENPLPPSPAVDDIYQYYPDGDSTHYSDNEWPTFTENLNTDRNVLLEDFTGHQCNNCPTANDLAEQMAADNYPRVIVSTIHSGPDGAGALQAWSATDPTFYHDFTSIEGSQIGDYFGSINFSGFFGNPRGLISRVIYNGQYTATPQVWDQAANDILSANDLKVNIQSVSNYYPSTRGLFLHTEVDVLDPALSPDDLRVVVQLHQDSIIRPQKGPNGTILDYVHRHVLLGCLDQLAFGQQLDTEQLANSGNYELFHFYQLPAEYNADNVHLVIYVRDAVTEEVYQVIKHTL